MNKNRIWVLIGLAIAAVAVVAGLTRDRWMAGPPVTVAGSDAAKTAEAPAPAPAANTTTQEKTATQEQTATAPQQPAAPAPAEQPAAPAAQQPAATTEQQTAAAQPAAQPEAPAQQETAAAQPPQPAASTDQQAAATTTTQPAAAPQPAQEPAAPAEQPAPAATQQQTAAAQPEQPAAQPQPEPKMQDQVPAFDTVRVEKTGEAVIAGTAEAGSEVVVKLDGQEIGKATANTDGAFVVVPDQPLPSGSGALTIESKGKGDLQATASEQSVAVIVPAEAKQEALVAIVSPNAPTKVLQKPAPQPEPEAQVASAQPESTTTTTTTTATTAAPQPAAAAKPVSIDAVDYDSAGNIVFSGQGTGGNTARVYVDNGFIGEAQIGDDGRWSFSGTADVGQGVHKLRVDGLDKSGKVVNRVEVPFFREEQSKVAAAAPQPQADQTVAKSEAPAQPASEQPAASDSGSQQAAAQPAAPAAAPAPKEGRVVIQPGNNLWRISRVLYGHGEKYTMLYEANKDQIRDPDLIYPGQIFKTPEVAPKVETIDPARRDPLKPEENAATAQ